MFLMFCFVLSIILFVGMLVLSNCNLFLAVHILVNMVTINVTSSFCLLLGRLFADSVNICCSGVWFVGFSLRQTF